MESDLALYFIIPDQLFCITSILLDDRDSSETDRRGNAVTSDLTPIQIIFYEFYKSVVLYPTCNLYEELYGSITDSNGCECHICNTLRIQYKPVHPQESTESILCNHAGQPADSRNTMISVYFIMFNMKLTNTYVGLVIAYVVWAVPFCTLMIKSYFDAAIPVAIEESARIDGCSNFGIFWRVCLPISVPGIISTGIFAFITAWNEYMWASIILSKDKLKPVSVGIYDFIGQYSANTKMAITMTAGIIITIPAIIIFAFLQKYLISGLSAGAVKG